MSHSLASTATSSQYSASTFSEERTISRRRAQQRPNNWWVCHAEKFSEVFCEGAEQRFSCGNGGEWNEDDEDDDVSNNFSVDDYSTLDESTLEGDESVLLEVPKARKQKEPKKSKQAKLRVVQEFKAIEEVKIPTHIIQKPRKREKTKEGEVLKLNDVMKSPPRRKETKEEKEKAQKVEDNIKSYSFFAKFGIREVKYEDDSTASATKTKKVFDHVGPGNHRGWGPSSRASSPQKVDAVDIRTKVLKDHLLLSDDDEDTFDDTLTADSLMRELSLMDHDEDQTQLLSCRHTFDDTYDTSADNLTLENTTFDDTYAEEETYDERVSFASSLPFDEQSELKNKSTSRTRSNQDFERELPSFGSSKNVNKNVVNKNKGIDYIAPDQSFGSSSHGTTVDRETHGIKPIANTKPNVTIKRNATIKPQAIIKPQSIKLKPVTVAQHRKKNIDLGKNRSRSASSSSSLTPQQFNYAINHALRTGE